MKPRYATIVAVIHIFLAYGCSRKVDPRAADSEVRKLLEDVPGFEWFPQSDSRLAYDHRDDLPVAPKDDAESRLITLRIQKEDSYPDGNLSEEVKNPHWKKSLPVDENGTIQLNLEMAMELALLHSRDFQEQKEALYLAALDVTYERFRLGPTPFLGARGEASREMDRERSDFESRAEVGFRGVAGRGANWVASLANRLSVDLSGGDAELGGSVANLTITQPLLRGASRRIYLEGLTQSERSLLANARSLEQFRHGFFLKVVLGSNPAASLRGSSAISPIPAPSTGVSGFLGLVQDVQRIRNQEANVAKLNDSLAQLEAAFEAGRIGSRLQVDQARQALFNGQSRLLAAKSSFTNNLDGYKLFLGLPPNMPMKVVDDYVERFRLTDADLVALQEEVSLILAFVRDPEKSNDLEGLVRISGRIEKLLPLTRKCIRKLILDFESFKKALPDRKAGFAILRERSDLRELGMGVDTFDDADLDGLLNDCNGSISRLSKALEGFERKLEDWIVSSGSIQLDEARGRLSVLLNAFSGTLLELSLAKASARLESIVMEDVEIVPKIATQVASANRMDWKNNRSLLVDVWRKADLAQEDLRTDLDLVISGDLGSDARSAGQFEPDESSVRVGLELDTPLSKVRERNRYKASLLVYQQSRRAYLAFEDSVLRAFREHQRLSQLFQLNFELSRAAVRGAIAQVDLARMRLDEPPQPGRNSQFGATTARDLVNALNDLLDASNGFVEVWIGFEAMRMRYAYDLGTMELSEKGLWVGTR